MYYREVNPMLHLYPQETWHADAAIVGSRMGLEKLRDTIEKVLASEGEPDEYGMVESTFGAIPSDGETHNFHVHLLPAKHPNWGHLALPYAINQDLRMDGRDDRFIRPPTWGMGLTRELDIIKVPVEAPYMDEMWDELHNYHSLSDEEKRAFRLRLRELEESERG